MESDKNNLGQNKVNTSPAKNSQIERDSYYLSFILKKTEKLVTAVYLLTDFLNSNEPLKWELRTKSVRLMSFVSATANQNASPDGMSFTRASGSISDIVSLLELASQLRFISDMNFTILRDEFMSLRTLIDGRERSNNPVADVSFPPAFFATGLPEPRLAARTRSTREPQDMATVEPALPVADMPDVPSVSPASSAFPPRQSMVSEERAARSEPLPRKRDDKSMRKDAIVKFLRARSGVSIKDIAAVIPNCSEKTVQRELIELMEAGVVTRAGERRWSTYSLAE